MPDCAVSNQLCLLGTQVLKEKNIKTLTIHPPSGGGKLNGDNVAVKLVDMLQSAESGAGSVPDEITV